MTFVPHLASAARQQAGDMAFHHWTARATRTGQVDLMRCALTVQACLVEDVEHLCRTGSGRERLDGFGELFRMLSYQEIGSAAMLGRACAGMVAGRIVASLPGSEGAVRLGMERLLLPELGHLVREASR